MTPSETESNCNLMAVHSPSRVISVCSVDLGAVMCSGWWYPPPQHTILHPVPLLYSPAQWLSLVKRSMHRVFGPFPLSCYFLSKEYRTRCHMMSFLAPHALQRLLPIILRCKVHLEAWTGVTDVTPYEVAPDPNFMLFSTNCSKRIPDILTVDDTSSVSSPNLGFPTFLVSQPTSSAYFDCKEYNGWFTTCWSARSELGSEVYSVFTMAIIQLSMCVCEQEGATVSNPLFWCH